MLKSVTRRAALTAAVAITAMPAAALATVTDPDPIFALLECHQRLLAQFKQVIADKGAAEVAVDDAMAYEVAEDWLGAATVNLEQEIITTPPATLAGAAAVARFVRMGLAEGTDICDGDGGTADLLLSLETTIAAAAGLPSPTPTPESHWLKIPNLFGI